MRPQLKLSIAMACGLLATATASAQTACIVTLSSMLPGGQMVLQAVCTGGPATAIDWKRNGTEIITNGVGLTTPVPDGQHIYLTTQALSGQYTANGSTTGSPYTFDTTNVPMTLNLSDPVLTVAATVGGSVSAPSGINACTSTAGTCSATYTAGSTVQLTATPSTGYIFSTWGGDCTGAVNVCALNMATLRTVSAAFAISPTDGKCGSADGTTSPTQPNESILCSSGASTGFALASNTWTWTCGGVSGGKASLGCTTLQQLPGACGSANGTAPQSAAPTGTAACSTGALNGSVATVGTNFQWTCLGVHSGATSGQCQAPISQTPGACATITNTLTTPPSTNGCTTGTVTGLTTPGAAGGSYTWTCAGLSGGQASGQCTAAQTVNGACGTASGSSFSAAPSSGLCAAGTSVQTAPSGSGPWSWGCNGVNGGSNTLAAACTASVASGNSCAATPSNITVQTWAGYANSSNVITQVISVGTGLSLQFQMDQTAYPLGFKLSDQGSGSKVYSFSRCPGGTDNSAAPILGQSGTTSVNGDATLDNCINIAGGYMRPVDTSGASAVFYNGSSLSLQKTCFLPTTTTQGSSTPATYYLNIINKSTTVDASIQYRNMPQSN